jgi:hypothetical protein
MVSVLISLHLFGMGLQEGEVFPVSAACGLPEPEIELASYRCSAIAGKIDAALLMNIFEELLQMKVGVRHNASPPSIPLYSHLPGPSPEKTRYDII